MSSVAAARAFRAHVPYVTSKGAVESLTRALAIDLASYGIRVNAIGPGMIATESWQAFSPEQIKHLRQIPLLKREGSVENIAGVVAFLASEDASYITGQIIYVDGGGLCQFYSPCAEIPHLIAPPPEHYKLK